jgi:hypothetical protein
MKCRSLALCLVVVSVALILTAISGTAVPVQEHIGSAQSELQKKATEVLIEGNLSSEKLSQEVNDTANVLKKQAVGHINETINISQSELEKRAKEEIQKQASQAIAQPGFELPLAMACVALCSLILRKRKE